MEGRAVQSAESPEPGLFSAQGMNDYYTARKWFSYTLIWFLSVPMFPHIFMRFFIPRTPESLRTTGERTRSRRSSLPSLASPIPAAPSGATWFLVVPLRVVDRPGVRS